jgi:hypothetical protein
VPGSRAHRLRRPLPLTLLAVLTTSLVASPAAAHHAMPGAVVTADELPLRVAAHPGIDVDAVIRPWNQLAGVPIFVKVTRDPDVVWRSAATTWVARRPGARPSCTIHHDRTTTWWHQHEIGHCLGLADHITVVEWRSQRGHVDPRVCDDTRHAAYHPYRGVMSYCQWSSSRPHWFGGDDARMLQANRIIPFVDLRDAGVHAPAVHLAARRGLTRGCSATRFCPTRSVTRAQMASFLQARTGLPDRASPFVDVGSGSVHAGAVGAMAHAGITVGCRPRHYCPNELVTRAQMATLLQRAYALAPAPAVRYEDVPPTGAHAAGISSVTAAAVANGCAERRFCPDRPVSRAQMASFLTRTPRPVAPPSAR